MASANRKYVCTLSAEMLEKAKKELNEDPNTRHIELKTLRERLEKVPGEKCSNTSFGEWNIVAGRLTRQPHESHTPDTVFGFLQRHTDNAHARTHTHNTTRALRHRLHTHAHIHTHTHTRTM